MDKATHKIPKISTMIWRPIIDKFDEKMEAACLRRDAYLNKVLKIELPRLDLEVSLANSIDAQAFIAGQLDQLDRKLVSIKLQPDLIELMKDICTRKRITRDAFFNRLFLLLEASPKMIDHLLFSDQVDCWRTEVWSTHEYDEVFFNNTFYPLDQDIDPFWSIRVGIGHYNKQQDLYNHINSETGKVVHVQRDSCGHIYPKNSLYTSLLRKFDKTDLYGLNCYISDWEIPNSPAKREHFNEIFKVFDNMEKS